jgi:hypothetical protein
MSQTLLESIQQASAEMALAIPNTVVGNVATDVQQMYYLINAAGNELAREFPWQALNTEYDWYSQYTQSNGSIVAGSSTITGVDPATVAFLNANGATNFQVQGLGVIQSTQVVSASGTNVVINSAATGDGTGNYVFGQVMYNLPAGFDRITDRTQYDKSKRWEMLGPETAQQWQWLKSSYISTGPRIRWRIMGQKFQIWPLTSTNEYLSFEYVSTNWAQSSAGVGQTKFLADTDTCIFPDRLIVLALKKKYFEVKGFDTSAFQRDYDMQLNLAKSNDAGSATLSLAPRVSNVLIGWENIPDANYGA